MTEAHPTQDSEIDDLPPIEDDLLFDDLPAERPPTPLDPLPPLGEPIPNGAHHGNGLEGDDASGSDAVRTAGGVIIVRAGETGPRLAVLESGGVISLPKAEVGPGMSAETAAGHAAESFVGMRVRLAESIGEIEEWMDDSLVTTWFWLGRPVRGAALEPTTPPPAGFHLHWIDPEEACQALTSPGEQSLVERVMRRPMHAKRRPFASLESVGLAREIEAFRDESAASARTMQDPEHMDALLRAREEIERAEARLARGDAAGARRARARAERETLSSLDPDGRALAFQRALNRAPDRLQQALRATAPPIGSDVSLEVLLAVQAAVDSAIEEDEREREIRREAQGRATVAFAATTLAILAAAWLGLFQTAPRPTIDTSVAAAIFVVTGALGGWVGEAIFALREANRGRHLALPMAAAAGALAGLGLGAILSGGLATFMVDDAALTVAATFAAGWLVRMLLPRGH